MGTAEVLREARALIDTPAKWTKGAAARDANGNSLHNHEDWSAAASLCVVGAITVAVDGDMEGRKEACYAVGRAFGWYGVKWPALMNDDDATTHADVMAAFDRAIAAAEAE